VPSPIHLLLCATTSHNIQETSSTDKVIVDIRFALNPCDAGPTFSKLAGAPRSIQLTGSANIRPRTPGIAMCPASHTDKESSTLLFLTRRSIHTSPSTRLATKETIGFNTPCARHSDTFTPLPHPFYLVKAFLLSQAENPISLHGTAPVMNPVVRPQVARSIGSLHREGPHTLRGITRWCR
jgi:hypothetical protein